MATRRTCSRGICLVNADENLCVNFPRGGSQCRVFSDDFAEWVLSWEYNSEGFQVNLAAELDGSDIVNISADEEGFAFAAKAEVEIEVCRDRICCQVVNLAALNVWLDETGELFSVSLDIFLDPNEDPAVPEGGE